MDSLTGNLLIAMPAMDDPRFERAVIYICSHGPEGAMGLVLNRIVDELDFSGLLKQLEIDTRGPVKDIALRAGGPVEMGRGFVLHSTDYLQDTSLEVSDDFALTATVDILRAIAEGGGPRHHLIALGYAGWGEGQLDQEMQANVWLSAEGRADLMFETPPDEMWGKAMAAAGVDVSKLSSLAGSA